MKKLGLYLHFPFCVKKCNYCDFLSFEIRDEDVYRDYAEAVALELGRWKDKLGGYEVDTIFLGGGTPSLMSSQVLDRIIEALYGFKLSKKLEFTIEANPKTLDMDKLSYYIASGINRLSLGVQSLDDRVLGFLGRIHNRNDFLKNYGEARKAGFENINVDLMFAIPNQNIDQWMDTVKQAIGLQPEHISFYSLIIEENTPLFNRKALGEIKELDEDMDRKMYWGAADLLCSRGYEHYEISNMAKDLYMCHHNMKYWSMDEYIGIGAGAHSYFQGRRFSNETDLNKYIKNANDNLDNKVWEHQNTRNDEISEYIFTGLRKIQGIDLDDFTKRFNLNIYDCYKEQIHQFILGKWMVKKNNQLMLSNKGLDISNRIMSEFIL